MGQGAMRDPAHMHAREHLQAIGGDSSEPPGGDDEHQNPRMDRWILVPKEACGGKACGHPGRMMGRTVHQAKTAGMGDGPEARNRVAVIGGAPSGESCLC